MHVQFEASLDPQEEERRTDRGFDRRRKERLQRKERKMNRAVEEMNMKRAWLWLVRGSNHDAIVELTRDGDSAFLVTFSALLDRCGVGAFGGDIDRRVRAFHADRRDPIVSYDDLPNQAKSYLRCISIDLPFRDIAFGGSYTVSNSTTSSDERLAEEMAEGLVEDTDNA